MFNLILYCTVDAAIRKMVATLGDPFTRFLEPQKFKSLRVQTSDSHLSASTFWLRGIC